MRDAWQTPHGARPNREGVGDGASRFQRVPARCAKPSGRSLEPFSNGRPRGMTVSGGNAVQNSAYRFWHHLRPSDSKGSEGLQLAMVPVALAFPDAPITGSPDLLAPPPPYLN